MPKIRVQIKLTAAEVKSLLPRQFQEIWIQLERGLEDLGYNENEANLIVAEMFLEWLKQRDKK